MALTEAQRSSVRLYVGWSERFHQFDSELEQAMNALATAPDGEAIVLAAVAACEDIDVKLTAAHGRLKAMKVGSIGLSGPGEIRALRSEGRRHAGRIASVLGVSIRHDVFTGSGPVATNYQLRG